MRKSFFIIKFYPKELKKRIDRDGAKIVRNQVFTILQDLIDILDNDINPEISNDKVKIFEEELFL